ncbi:MAG TPA: 23S rRNA (cytosine(1962)-C(5))-methyltransferase RlmI [Desulfobacteraceae bacterium]|nr:class I SAM-dependent methyltransferase [Deltaproteobacteria bacterium]HDI58995.1 23S rRNA (cytosine(1962)-C(5))-methyltransferase RlmI [Desulfobacteraceae bacterium]
MNAVIIKKGREASLLRRHPWVFSGSVARLVGSPGRGETMQIQASDGRPLGVGAYSPDSQIRVRVWDHDPQTVIDTAFFQHRLASAISWRSRLPHLRETNAWRLVNGESDGLPGLVVDRYADFAVCQFLSAGADAWRNEIVAALRAQFPLQGVFERSDTEARRKEGLLPSVGSLWGAAPPECIEITEGPLRFQVDVRTGHKTGFYLDQRENRRLVAAYSAGAKVLNAFAYTGAFGLWALAGGAQSVIQLETSTDALAMAETHAPLNGFAPAKISHVCADVFKQLRAYRDEGRRFDLIILDPPKFAAAAGQVSKAARGYKDINLLAFRLLNPGGTLFTFSCSGHVDTALFQKIVFDAALDAGCTARILHDLGQAPDHPVALNFPEGRYLKGLAVGIAD